MFFDESMEEDVLNDFRFCSEMTGFETPLSVRAF